MQHSSEETITFFQATDIIGTIKTSIEKDRNEQEVVQFYDNWAVNYDKDLDRVLEEGSYKNHRLVVEYLEEFVPCRSARVLDVACGTGRVGRLLKAHGFTNVDGEDGSKAMLDVARQHDLYENYFVEFITEKPMQFVPCGAYDAAIITGGFTRSHLTAKCLKTIGQCLKRGGVFINVMRGEVLEWSDFQDMEPTMERLEREGFWKIRDRRVIEECYDEKVGIAHIYEKL